MKKFYKILSIALLLSYLTVSTGKSVQMSEMLYGFSFPVFFESKTHPFSPNWAASFKLSFKHVPSYANDPPSLFYSQETIEAATVLSLQTVCFFGKKIFSSHCCTPKG